MFVSSVYYSEQVLHKEPKDDVYLIGTFYIHI
jgi:hypothetical protein